MNKKILFLILLAAIIISPAITHAISQRDKACIMVRAVKDAILAVGVTLVIIGWVVAGILYLTSAGSPERMKTAKTALIAAIIGTLLVILASTSYDFIRTLFGNIGEPSSGCG